MNKPLERKLASYHSLGIDISATDEKTKSYLNNFRVVLVKMARKDSGFEKVGIHPAGKPFHGIQLKLTITGVSEGNKAQRAMNMGGEAEFVVNAVMTDGMDAAPLANFVVKGNSLRTSRTSINGFDTGMGGVFDDMVGKAMAAASEEIVGFLKNNQ